MLPFFPVKPPKDDYDQYICRHHYPALNVLILVGYSGRIYYCGSSNPGSTCDSPNLMTTDIPQRMQTWLESNLPFPDAMIGGDGIFQTNLKWLCTPYKLAEAAADPIKRQFNLKFCACRATVERYIGVFKERFAILDYKLKFDAVTDSMKMVQVCAAIHNFIVEQQNPADRIRDENALLEQRNIRLGPVVEDQIENDIVHDGTMATNDYLLQKYNEYFRIEPEIDPEIE